MKALLALVVLLSAAPARALQKERACQDFSSIARTSTDFINKLKSDLDKTKDDMDKQKKKRDEAQRKIPKDKQAVAAAQTDDQKDKANSQLAKDENDVKSANMAIQLMGDPTSDSNKVYQRACNVYVKTRDAAAVLECPVSSRPDSPVAFRQVDDSNPGGMPNTSAAGYGNAPSTANAPPPSNNSNADVDCPPGMHPIGHGKCQRDQYGGGSRADNPANYFKNRGGH